MSFPVPPVYCPQVKSKMKSQVYRQRIARMSPMYHMRHKHFLLFVYRKVNATHAKFSDVHSVAATLGEWPSKLSLRGTNQPSPRWSMPPLETKVWLPPAFAIRAWSQKSKMKKYFAKSWHDENTDTIHYIIQVSKAVECSFLVAAPVLQAKSVRKGSHWCSCTYKQKQLSIMWENNITLPRNGSGSSSWVRLKIGLHWSCNGCNRQSIANM